MAPPKSSNVTSDKSKNSKNTTKTDINTKADLIIQSRKCANDIFDIFEYLQVSSCTSPFLCRPEYIFFIAL